MYTKITSSIDYQRQKIEMKVFISQLNYQFLVDHGPFPIDYSITAACKRAVLKDIIKKTLEETVPISNDYNIWLRQVDYSVKENFPTYSSSVTPLIGPPRENFNRKQYDMNVLLCDKTTGLYIICAVLMDLMDYPNRAIVNIKIED